MLCKIYSLTLLLFFCSLVQFLSLMLRLFLPAIKSQLSKVLLMYSFWSLSAFSFFTRKNFRTLGFVLNVFWMLCMFCREKDYLSKKFSCKLEKNTHGIMLISSFLLSSSVASFQYSVQHFLAPTGNRSPRWAILCLCKNFN